MLGMLDALRVSLQDEMDDRFLKAFAQAEAAQEALMLECQGKMAVNAKASVHAIQEDSSQKLMKKESSH